MCRVPLTELHRAVQHLASASAIERDAATREGGKGVQ